jgi:hypothetical protein
VLCRRPVLDRRAIVGAPIFGNDGVLEHIVGDADWCALEETRESWRRRLDLASSALGRARKKIGTRLAVPAPPPPPRIRRLNVRLRCENDDEDENGGDAVRPPRWPRRPGVVIEEEPCAADGGSAMAVQRGSREETSRREGSACEPGRAGERAGGGDGEASEGGACGGD